MLKVDFPETSISPKQNFPYRIAFIEFFLPKLIFTTSFHYVYLGLIFLGLG